MLPFCVTHIVILLRLEEHKLSLVCIKLGDILLTAGLVSLAVVVTIMIPLLRPTGDEIEVEINGEKYGTSLSRI